MPQTVLRYVNGHHVGNIDKMKVKDLIEQLQRFDGDAYVKSDSSSYPQSVERGTSGENEVVIK